MTSILTTGFTTAYFLSDTAYYAVCGILTLGVLFGIHLMSRVEKAQLGNQISALAIALAIVLTLVKKDIIPVWILYPAMAVGLIVGLIMAKRVTMIQMPQLVALFNGMGGAASALVASFAFISLFPGNDYFGRTTSALAVAVGMVTLTGSLVAAGKLHQVFDQKPVILPFHQATTISLAVILLLLVIIGGITGFIPASHLLLLMIVLSSLFGAILAIRVGGADMPITISLLNSFSGVAAAIAGFAVNDILLVAVGGIVGASGLFLTQIMCRAMNRKLSEILLGKTSLREENKTAPKEETGNTPENKPETVDPVTVIKSARNVIIVPGYGMALAHAQHLVKKIARKLADNGASVKFAIHPVAGRMPGHMDVLLIEAGVPFEDVFEMDDINEEFRNADLTIVVGANDVMNPAARNTEGTPISGMPILNVDHCRNIVIFNYDLKPGYSGVDNPIYSRGNGVWIIQGDAAVTLQNIVAQLEA